MKTSSNYLIVGIVAAILVGIAEWLLHFSPQGPQGEIAMLFDVPLARASVGHFLAIVTTPLYFIGYYGLLQVFKSTDALLAKLLFIGGVISFFVGGIWLSSRYFAAEVLQRSAGTPDFEFYLQSYETHYQILVWALRFLVLGISIIYILLILKNKIGLPKWLAILNPTLILIIVISTLFWIKPLGVHIAPIAMNTTHFIFFSLILFFLKPSTNYEMA